MVEKEHEHSPQVSMNTLVDKPTITIIENAFEPGQAQKTVLSDVSYGLTVAEALPERVKPDTWIVVDSGRVLSPEEWKFRLIVPGTQLVCYVRMSGAVGRMIAGGVLMAIGAVLSVTPAFAFGIPIGLMGVGMLAGGAVDLIMGSPKMANVPALSRGDQESSPTYGVFGLQSVPYRPTYGFSAPLPYRVQRGSEGPEGPLHMILDRDGRSLSPDELADLAQQPQVSITDRWMTCIVCDESIPRHGKPFLRPQRLKFLEVPSFTLLATGLSIGSIDKITIHPPGRIPGTEGFSCTATALIADTVLGMVAWQAMQAGILNGVCLSGIGAPDETGELPSYEAKNIALGHIDGACIPNSRVCELRETPRHEKVSP